MEESGAGQACAGMLTGRGLSLRQCAIPRRIRRNREKRQKEVF